jgi:membrane protein required for beta-lactamase induction
MSPIELQILLDTVLPFAVALAAIGTGGKIITTWLRSRGGKDSTKALQELSRQIQQLQESVDTVAVEVERIEEAQRFNARLLAEGRGESAPRTP